MASLPLKGSANILVAGDGADNIGKQAGGWTITWQGTEATPTATSPTVRRSMAASRRRPNSSAAARRCRPTVRSPSAPTWRWW
ncbi:MAG: hypothetical protein WDN06_09310 [Asticcacaulis sp.]